MVACRVSAGVVDLNVSADRRRMPVVDLSLCVRPPRARHLSFNICISELPVRLTAFLLASVCLWDATCFCLLLIPECLVETTSTIYANTEENSMWTEKTVSLIRPWTAIWRNRKQDHVCVSLIVHVQTPFSSKALSQILGAEENLKRNRQPCLCAIMNHRLTLVRRQNYKNAPDVQPCLVPFEIPKLYKIFYHIEFFNICMKY